MENRISELEDSIRLLMARIEEGLWKQNEMAAKIEFLEYELENTVGIDVKMMEQSHQRLKHKQSRIDKKRLIGYKVKYFSTNNINSQHPLFRDKE